MKIKILLFVLLINTVCADAKHLYPEKYYQNQWCSQWGGKAEYVLNDKTRVDCLTKNYAVEFDFSPKWAEAIGQALYYAKKTNKKPAIILIIEKPSDFKHYRKAELLAKDYNIKVWYIKAPLQINYNIQTNINNLLAQYLPKNKR